MKLSAKARDLYHREQARAVEFVTAHPGATTEEIRAALRWPHSRYLDDVVKAGTLVKRRRINRGTPDMLVGRGKVINRYYLPAMDPGPKKRQRERPIGPERIPKGAVKVCRRGLCYWTGGEVVADPRPGLLCVGDGDGNPACVMMMECW